MKSENLEKILDSAGAFIKKNKHFVIASSLYLTTAAFDAYSTVKCLDEGGEELHPIVQPYIDIFGHEGVWGIKALTIPIIFLCRHVANKRKSNTPYYLLYGGSALQAIVAANNYSILHTFFS